MERSVRGERKSHRTVYREDKRKGRKRYMYTVCVCFVSVFCECVCVHVCVHVCVYVCVFVCVCVCVCLLC